MEHERLLCERSNLRDQHRKLKNEKTDDFIKRKLFVYIILVYRVSYDVRGSR